MKPVIIDTSGIVAAMNVRDTHHSEAKKSFLRAAQERRILVITNYVRAETHALLISRAGKETALRFLEDNSWVIEWVTPEDERKAIELLTEYHDKAFSLTDATTFTVAKRLGIDTAIAFDRHFRQIGLVTL